MRCLDVREREKEILDLIVSSYISESRPISSTYLCQAHDLPYSSATVRHVMENLEKKGLLYHIHTSSGRVPTQNGFKEYVEHIKETDKLEGNLINISWEIEPSDLYDIENFFNTALDVLAENSGYASLVALSGTDSRCLFRGARFILEQPEFEDIQRLRKLFYILEVKIDQIQQLLFNYFDETMSVLVGDQIGFEEISDCSLVVSGVRLEDLSFALALLGPMRMNYIKAASCLGAVKKQFKKVLKNV